MEVLGGFKMVSIVIISILFGVVVTLKLSNNYLKRQVTRLKISNESKQKELGNKTLECLRLQEIIFQSRAPNLTPEEINEELRDNDLSEQRDHLTACLGIN